MMPRWSSRGGRRFRRKSSRHSSITISFRTIRTSAISTTKSARKLERKLSERNARLERLPWCRSWSAELIDEVGGVQMQRNFTRPALREDALEVRPDDALIAL